MSGLAIWWLNDKDVDTCMALNVMADLAMPAYVKTELTSLQGRNGRGRLWVSDKLPYKFREVVWPSNNVLFTRLELLYGGIVIMQEHVSAVVHWPGFIMTVRDCTQPYSEIEHYKGPT